MCMISLMCGYWNWAIDSASLTRMTPCHHGNHRENIVFEVSRWEDYMGPRRPERKKKRAGFWSKKRDVSGASSCHGNQIFIFS